MSHLWSLGFGKLTPETLTGLRLSSGRTMVAIFIANAPQTLLSCFYLATNTLLTSMLLADEWSRFAHQRKTLRVTSPVDKQRSTYTLTLPYSYSIPQLTAFGLLHWLVSQSLFLARLDVYDRNNTLDQGKSISSCGSSPIALVLSLVVIVIIIIPVIGVGLRRYKPGMPYVGNCSAAISAACHAPIDDKGASRKPVRWGAVSHGSVEGCGQEIGHCTLTSLEVELPVVGRIYAGQ